ncbi:MAG: acyltransferase family protein [Rhodocyclaceae bacterium]
MSRSFAGPMQGLDVFKAVAAQLIVLHHLAFYGPMPDAAWSLAPDLFGWLANHARVAVQLFIVMAGFLTAHTLAPAGQLSVPVGFGLVARRYLRLALPFCVALLVCMACSALVRGTLDPALVPHAPSARQFLAHVFLMHDLFGFDALSAGAWYVAIDLQLFVLFLGLMHFGGRIGQYAGAVLVFCTALAGFFHFNRDASWDVFGVYYFGAYGLGVYARWALNSLVWRRAFGVLAVIAVLALIVDYRVRLAVAVVMACMLCWSLRWQLAPLVAALSRYLARTSYALFLTHFSVLLLINMVATRWFGHSRGGNLAGLLLAWGLANVVAHVFHRRVEVPALQWIARVRPRLAAGAAAASA